MGSSLFQFIFGTIFVGVGLIYLAAAKHKAEGAPPKVSTPYWGAIFLIMGAKALAEAGLNGPGTPPMLRGAVWLVFGGALLIVALRFLRATIRLQGSDRIFATVFFCLALVDIITGTALMTVDKTDEPACEDPLMCAPSQQSSPPASP